MDYLSETTKRCTKCGEDKPLLGFYVRSAGRDGRAPMCKPCHQRANGIAYKARRAADPIGVWAKHSLHSARKRAAAAGLPFALTVSMLAAAAPSVCPALGIPLDYSGKRACQADSPSVDRIRANLGYVPGNIQVLSVKANAIKQNASPEEIAAVAEHYRRLLHQSGE